MNPAEIKVDDKTYFYKFDRPSIRGFGYRNFIPGEWLTEEGDLRRGYGHHVCEARRIIRYMKEELYIVEVRGEYHKIGGRRIRVDDPDHDLCSDFLYSEMRFIRRVDAWNDVTMRLFAIECAAHVMPLWEDWACTDRRPHRAISGARRYLLGKIDEEAISDYRRDAERAIHDVYRIICTLDAELDAERIAIATAAISAASAAAAAADFPRPIAPVTAIQCAKFASYHAIRAVEEAHGGTAWQAEMDWQAERLIWYAEGNTEFATYCK
jgi:hypothetical protein